MMQVHVAVINKFLSHNNHWNSIKLCTCYDVMSGWTLTRLAVVIALLVVRDLLTLTTMSYEYHTTCQVIFK